MGKIHHTKDADYYISAADHFFVDKHFEQVVGYVNQTIESLEIVG